MPNGPSRLTPLPPEAPCIWKGLCRAGRDRRGDRVVPADARPAGPRVRGGQPFRLLAIAFAVYGVALESSCNFWSTTVTGILMVYHWNPNENQIDGLPLAS